MQQKTWILILSLLLTIVTSCVENLNTEYTSERKVVVNCILTNDTVQQLSLTYSNSLNKTYYDEVSDAKITLFDCDDSVGQFYKAGYGEWHLDFKPEYGHKYDIKVEIPGREIIKASTVFPTLAKAKRVRENDNGSKLAFEVKSDNTYWICAFSKDKDTIMYPVVLRPEYKAMDELGTNCEHADHFNLYSAADEIRFANKHKKYIRIQSPDSVECYTLYDLYSSVVVFMAVSDEYDKYLKSSIQKLITYESSGDPAQWLDESMIYSNITNGVGIFGANAKRLVNCNSQLP